MTDIRSRKVRRILTLERRALRLQAQHERALASAASAEERAEALRRTARDLEFTLTGTHLAELRGVRGESP